MDFGIALPTAADSWRVTKEAEELGFTHAWFYDTQMLSADCFVAMGAAAVKTRRIRLGTGVLVPSNRIAPVAANALATLNQLAPGRIDFGVGTGFTARRAMGFGAIKVKDMETYIHQVYGLLRRETVEFEMEGQKKKIRFLNPELPLFNTKDPIALHLSAFGPRTQALTARLKAGWIYFVGKVENDIKEVEAMMRAKNLHTVCESARCPNLPECWSKKTATFMILGDTCTRSCGFCAIKVGKGLEVDRFEPANVAKVANDLGLLAVRQFAEPGNRGKEHASGHGKVLAGTRLWSCRIAVDGDVHSDGSA